MNYFSPLHLVVYGFLLLTLIVGLYSGRNVKTFKDYATANKSLGTGVLTVTLLATVINAEWIERIGYTHIVGPVMACAKVPIIIVFFLLMSTYLAPKLIRFQRCFTVGQLMGELYGPAARQVVSYFTLVITLLVIAAQLSFIGQLTTPLLGITYYQVIWIGGGLIITYSLLGGIRSVAFTDFLQFATLVIVLALLTYRVTGEAGGLLQLFSSISKYYPEKLSLATHAAKLHLGYGSILLEVLFFGVFGGLLSPPIIQRMLLANKKEDLARMLASSAGIIPMFYFLFASIGLGALVLYPTLSRDAILPTLITKLFGATMQGVMLVGLLAVMMSTIDSFLHGAAITVVSDLFYPNDAFDRDEAKHLRLVRLVTGALGVIALCIAAGFRGNIALNYFAWLTFSFIMVPLIAGIMGLKTHPRDFWLAFGVALLVEGIGDWITLQHCETITFRCWVAERANFTTWLFAILANVLTYFLSHYLRHGAFVRVAPQNAGELAWQPKWKSFITWLGELLPTPRNAKRFANTTVFADKEGYVLAFFIAVNYMAPFFMSVSVTKTEFTGTMMLLKSIAALLCTGILANSRWPKALKKRYYELYWLLTITFCIPFMAAFVFLLDGGSTITIFNILLAITLMVAIVNWKGFVAMSTLGIGAAWGMHHLVYGPVQLHLGVEEWFLFVYSVLFGTLIGGLFVRKTAQHTAETLEEKDTFASFVGHELGNHLAIMSAGRLFELFLTKRTKEAQEKGEKTYHMAMSARERDQLLQQARDLVQEKKKAEQVMKTFTGLLNQHIGKKHALTSLAAIAQEGCDGLEARFRDRANINVVADPDFELSFSHDTFIYVVRNLVKNAIVHGEATEVVVRIDGSRRTLTVQDNGKGIPIPFLPQLFQLFHTSNQRKGTGVGLAFVQRTVATIGGDLQLAQNKQTGDPYTTFQITFLL